MISNSAAGSCLYLLMAEWLQGDKKSDMQYFRDLFEHGKVSNACVCCTKMYKSTDIV